MIREFYIVVIFMIAQMVFDYLVIRMFLTISRLNDLQDEINLSFLCMIDEMEEKK